MLDKVDVLIVGSGASGAAVAWSLADTKMRIVCLEQGDWVKSDDYPGLRLDWETGQFGKWAFSPNVRQRPEDYPVNESGSPIQVAMFNAVGGSTILYAATSRASTRRTSAPARWTAWATTGRSTMRSSRPGTT